jgi:hypothetical protein
LTLRWLVLGANTGVNTNKKEDSDFGKTEEGEVKTPRLKLRLKMPNMRQSSNDHRRKATSGSSAQDLEGMRQASGAGAASEEAVDDMEVDEVDQMDIGMDAGIEDERDWLDVSILDAGIEERDGWEKRVVKGYFEQRTQTLFNKLDCSGILFR